MPIQLNDLQSASASTIKTYTPKFFSSQLTGKGKKIGLINENRNPIYIQPAQNTPHDAVYARKRKYTNGNTVSHIIPMSPIKRDMYDIMSEISTPDTADMTEIGKYGNTTFYIYMPIHSVIITEVDTSTPTSKSSSRTVLTCYQILIYAIADTNKSISKLCNGTILEFANAVIKSANKENHAWSWFTCNPMSELQDIAATLAPKNINLSMNAITQFITDYDLYNAICKRSEEWQTSIDKTLDVLFKKVVNYAYNAQNASSKPKCLNMLAHQIRYIEDYNVPLDLYRNIYNNLITKFNHDDAVILCKQNLNLLLSDTLHNLNSHKSNLICLPQKTQQIYQQIQNASVPAMFSAEQKKAIMSAEPLIIVQSGAGCGKSTVIRGRIDYMIACGVEPKDITVLSFTNAAANHILEICPGVHSMTIASMIHNIYTENFSNHELSSADTMINCIDIYFKNDQIASDFKRNLKSIVKNDADAFTQMNNFVEYHYNDVIRIMNTIGQTCLEMEIIICYQQIDNFKEPANVQSKYLIVDEVQDNSIFEFIYVLKYVDKHNESLFIVGDCSQTLYEFRASNPKALNVLEGSGVFAAYQLQVNYRSNQEILDFANIALQNIEANQYAHIQLQANNLKTVTEKSFTDAVHFKYECLSKISDFNLTICNLIRTEIKPYIDAKIAAGEKVTFLAHTRRHVNAIKVALEEMYPDKTIVSLIPDKMYNTVIFSEFIKRYWSEIKFVPSQNIVNIIAQEIYSKLDYLVYNKNKALPSTQRLIANWLVDQGAAINAWLSQVNHGQMTVDAFMENVKQSMLQFEIKNNAVKQALLAAKNETNKQSNNIENADFIMSTIHSAKGLEFDNVVIIYKNENDMPEDKKRMYYVAFTRAIKSEFILAYDSTKNPKIEADYNTIVKNLHAKYPDPNSKLNTVAVNSGKN